jgi:hypothetical protein
MKNWKSLLWVFIIIIGITSIIFYAALNITYSNELANTLQALQYQGKFLSPQMLKTTVDEKANAAEIYNEIFSRMTEQGEYGYIPNKQSGNLSEILLPLIEINTYNINSLPADTKQQITILIRSPEVEELFSLVDKAVNREQCNFNLDYEKGPSMPMPHLSLFKNLINMIITRSMAEEATGNTGKAFDVIHKGFKVANHLKDEPVLVSQLVRTACEISLINRLQTLIEKTDIQQGQAKKIIQELQTHPVHSSFLKAMNTERSIFGNYIYKTLMSDPSKLKNFDKSMPFLLKTPLSKPILKKDMTTYLQMSVKLDQGIAAPYYKFTEEMKILPELKKLPDYYLISHLLLPSLTAINVKIADYDAHLNICWTGLALEIFKSKKGSYPVSLESLVPEILQGIPIDPFTGEPLIYRNEKTMIAVYSTGPDLKDDMGKPYQNDRQNYDIIWSINK